MEITENADLTNFSTLRVVANTDKLVMPSSIEELVSYFEEIKASNSPWHVLGAGSNVLLSSRSIPGTVISTNNIDFRKQISETSFEVGAGLRMPRLCALMAKESLSGTEFMEGIPGSVGGGVVMNAGAHGSDWAKITKSVKVFDTEMMEVLELSTDELGLSYRSSRINPSKQIVLSAIIELEKASKEDIRAKISENNKARSTHQPIKAWTCGCTFKNPGEERAGQLIDELGAKGAQEGSIKVSEKHGNFFENTNGGTSMDFCKLMGVVQNLAFKDKGIILSPEVKQMGEFTAEEKLIWHPEKKFAITKVTR